MTNIGLDFGTTNTRLSWGGTPWRCPLSDNGMLPSAIAYLPNGKILVGEAARNRFAIDPFNIIFGPKRLVGTRYTPGLAAQLQNSYGALLVNNNGKIAFSTRQGVFYPEEICVEIIRYILNAADVIPKETSIAMTVPVAFEDRRRQALVSVARQLGFTRIRLLEEPIATAVAYIGRCNVQRAAVFDLGGGTFDFSIIGCSGKNQGIEVLATGGEEALGGDEIDQILAKWAAEKILEQTGWDLKSERTVFLQAVAAAEQAKIALTHKEETFIALDTVDDAAPIAMPKIKVSRNILYELALPLIQKMFLICDEVRHQAKTSIKEIDAVFMSGSGSLLYGLKRAVAQYFGLPVRTDIDPAFVVSIGAGLAMARPSLHSLFQRI